MTFTCNHRKKWFIVGFRKKFTISLLVSHIKSIIHLATTQKRIYYEDKMWVPCFVYHVPLEALESERKTHVARQTVLYYVCTNK